MSQWRTEGFRSDREQLEEKRRNKAPGQARQAFRTGRQAEEGEEWHGQCTAEERCEEVSERLRRRKGFQPGD